MLPYEFLFFLFLLRLLIDELLIDVNVLIGDLLRNGFNFWCFLDHLLLYILHKERGSSLWVMRVTTREWVRPSKNASSIAGNALGIEPALWRCYKLLIRGCISAIVINVVNGYGLFTNKAIVHDQSTVLLVASTWHRMLHPMLFKVVPDLISLILKPLSWSLPDVLRVFAAATWWLSLYLLLLYMLDIVWSLTLMLLLMSVQRMHPRSYITSSEEFGGSLLGDAKSTNYPSNLLGDKAILDDLLDTLFFTIAVEGGRVQDTCLVRSRL